MSDISDLKGHAMTLPASKRNVPDDPAMAQLEISDGGLDRIGSLAAETGRHIVDLAGFLAQIDADAGQQLGVVDDVASQARDLTQITRELTDGLGTVAAANARALATVDGSIDTLKASANNSRDVATWVGQLDDVLGSVETTLTQVSRANQRIAEIAKQVNILAVNARIEAARAGEMGRGFAVVAEAINALSSETSSAATDVTSSTGTLTKLIGGLRGDARGVATSAVSVLDGAASADDALTRISVDVRAASADTVRLTESSSAVSGAVERFAPAFQGLNQALRATAEGVQMANRRAEEIVDINELAVQLSVELGAANADAHLIEMVQDGALAIGAEFERAIDAGRISMADLFDSTYRPIPGTQPEQMMAPFTELTDALLPPIQEGILNSDPRVAFSAAVDKNGYLPTHNRKFSKPQGSDPAWNASNCRNRRIFDDRVGLKAGRNTAPFLMQTYRRDMGGGRYVAMKDVSAPIYVQGRHWGGLRMGFAPDQNGPGA